MQLILFDDQSRRSLLPFTHTRPIADIRCGILTMRERWERIIGVPSSTLTENYLQPLFPLTVGDDQLLINAAVFATQEIRTALLQLKKQEKLIKGETVIGARVACPVAIAELACILQTSRDIHFSGEIKRLQNVWDIFSQNDRAIRDDFALLTNNRKSADIPAGVLWSGRESIFLEEGSVIHPGVVINGNTGPVYLGKEAEILEGALLRGPVALGEHAVVKMGAKIYGATTIGDNCKVGGEISNVVFFANSNKGHDGYLGNAVIGEWCNLGADTNCSNLKNNYDTIKIWDEHQNKSVHTGLQFCGLLMGDHSKCGINTMFNTGTVVGVSANIFGAGFPEKFIPSFCWGGSESMVTYHFDRAMETAKRMMQRRGKIPGNEELSMLRHIFEQTKPQRELFANN